MAARLLQADANGLRYADGAFSVTATEQSVSLVDVAVEAEGSLDTFVFDEDVPFTFPNGCQAAEVEIDPDTGVVEVVDWTAVDDVGRAINPMTLDGQTHGGVLQGIGQALMENCAYDTETGQMVGATFMDYAMPRANIVPAYRTKLLEIPSPSNPLGIKPGSEGGTAVAPAAIANAIVDALEVFGVDHIELPASPERVWRAMRGF